MQGLSIDLVRSPLPRGNTQFFVAMVKKLGSVLSLCRRGNRGTDGRPGSVSTDELVVRNGPAIARANDFFAKSIPSQASSK